MTRGKFLLTCLGIIPGVKIVEELVKEKPIEVDDAEWIYYGEPDTARYDWYEHASTYTTSTDTLSVEDIERMLKQIEENEKYWRKVAKRRHVEYFGEGSMVVPMRIPIVPSATS